MRPDPHANHGAPGRGCGCARCKEPLPVVAVQTPAEAEAIHIAWLAKRQVYLDENVVEFKCG